MKKPRNLTAKERAFAERILAGDGPSVAYRAAGYGCGSNARVIAVAAQRSLNRPAVAAYLADQQERMAARSTLTREDKLRRLADRVKHGKMVDRDGLKALEIHNLMTGDNAPQQVNVFGLSDLLDMVRRGNRPPTE
jgi:phage terminase small subunit